MPTGIFRERHRSKRWMNQSLAIFASGNDLIIIEGRALDRRRNVASLRASIVVAVQGASRTLPRNLITGSKVNRNPALPLLFCGNPPTPGVRSSPPPSFSYTFVLVESTTRLRGPLSPRPFRPVGRQCRHISLSARSSRPPRQPRRGGGGRGDFPGGSSPMGSMEGGQGSGEEIMPPQAIPLKPKSTLGVALRESIEEDNSSFEWIQNEQIRWLSGQKEEINLLKYSRRLPAPGGKRGEVGPLIPKKKAMEEHADILLRIYFYDAQRVRLADLGKMVIDLMYNMILFRFKVNADILDIKTKFFFSPSKTKALIRIRPLVLNPFEPENWMDHSQTSGRSIYLL
eukprot:1361433-Amorphochlora_amoeboformis.AAC.1